MSVYTPSPTKNKIKKGVNKSAFVWSVDCRTPGDEREGGGGVQTNLRPAVGGEVRECV